MTDPLFQYAPYTPGSTDLDSRVAWLEQQYSRLNGLISGWAGEGTEPYFNFLRARQSFFDFPPLEVARLRRTTTQVIPNATPTGLNFEESNWNTGVIDWSSITNSSRLYIKRVGETGLRAYLFSVRLQWDGSTLGDRQIQIGTWRADETSHGVLELDRRDLQEANFGAISATAFVRGNSSVTFYTVEVRQGSGSTLAIANADVGIMRIL